MSIDMTPPPAVVKFAEKAGYKWDVEYVREWNGFQVYFPNLEPSVGTKDVGLPQYILLKNNEIRWADNTEQSDLMYLDNKEK